MVIISLLTIIALALLFPRVYAGPPPIPAPRTPWVVDFLLLILVFVLWAVAFLKLWG